MALNVAPAQAPGTIMSLATYLQFTLANRRFLGYGFFIALFSSFGQTYFIGIFGPALQAEFGLSHTAWGTVYMLGTFASAAVLPWSGKQIDRLDLRQYTAWVCLLMVLACAFMAWVPSAWLLVVAIFLLRQSGQGLLSHMALTSMTRYFDRHRGRGIAIASLGFSAGEACLPFAAVLLIAALGWRGTYALAALVVLLVVTPGALWLLRGHGDRHRAHERHLTRRAGSGGAPVPVSWTRAQVMRDARFYLLLPGLLTPSLIITAMFFHHLSLADAKGWSHAWITGNYVLFAISTVITALVIGPLVDRFGALRLVNLMLVPIAMGLLVVSALSGAWVVWPYLFLMGITTGMSHTLGSAVWAELYGVTWLGSIRSLAAALGVFSSALGPVSAGLLMDAGLALEQVCLVYVVLAVLATVLMLYALSRHPPPPCV